MSSKAGAALLYRLRGFSGREGPAGCGVVDLPYAGRPFRLCWRKVRFECLNPDCAVLSLGSIGSTTAIGLDETLNFRRG